MVLMLLYGKQSHTDYKPKHRNMLTSENLTFTGSWNATK